MNSTLDAEIEKIVRAAKQELVNTTARVHKEMRQLSTSLKKETEVELARYALKLRREADTGVQIIGFIKPYQEANQRAG